jgi:hypothetical protein
MMSLCNANLSALALIWIIWPHALQGDTILFYVSLCLLELLQDCLIYCNSITNLI